jgi:hypothetical protein
LEGERSTGRVEGGEKKGEKNLYSGVSHINVNWTSNNVYRNVLNEVQVGQLRSGS